MNNALYNQIRIFQSIAREGNISAAARKLEITPPSVSNALRLLEEHIGHPLFVRTTRRIELTETGQQLLEQTAAAVETLEKSLEIIRDQNQEPSGAVRITLSRFAYLLILKPAMAAFCQQYPGSSWKYRSMTVPSILLKNVSTLGSALAIFSKAAWSPAR